MRTKPLRKFLHLQKIAKRLFVEGPFVLFLSSGTIDWRIIDRERERCRLRIRTDDQQGFNPIQASFVFEAA